MGFVVAFILVDAIIRFSKSGKEKEAKPLLFALGLFALGFLNDSAVTSGIYSFIYTMEYAYLGMVLLMTVSMSSTMISAAKLKHKLELSNIELETISEELGETGSRKNKGD